MIGDIKRYLTPNFLKPKKKTNQKKRRNSPGSTYRDYRGVDGAVNDAEKGKK